MYGICIEFYVSCVLRDTAKCSVVRSLPGPTASLVAPGFSTFTLSEIAQASESVNYGRVNIS